MSATRTPGIAPGSQPAMVIAGLMAIYMQAVNISIPNAALPHIQGTLSMADDEVGWVFTSYIAAGIVVMPLSDWLGNRFGRKVIYQCSLALFGVGLVLVMLATTPIQFVLARIVQGAASGTLVPLSTAILLGTVLPAHHSRISFASTVCVLVGISSGPSIGGWLSEYHGWPSIFAFSLPMACYIFLTITLSPPEKKVEQRQGAFDFFGFATFMLGIVGLQALLDRGERLEWFSSTEIWIEAAACVLGFYLFLVHVATTEVHFLNKALFKDRNFLLSTIMIFGSGIVLLPTLALTSPMLEELLNYPVDTTGYMTIPRGAALVAALVLMNFVPNRFDILIFVFGGSMLVVYANWLMLGYSPEMDWRPVVTAGMLQGAGLGTLMPALAKAAFNTLDSKFRPQGAALLNMTRLYGSTIGVSIVQIFLYRNTQAMHLALVKHLRPYSTMAHGTGSMARPALARLNDIITDQAAVVAVIGQFKILLIAMLIVTPLVLFLRKPRNPSPEADQRPTKVAA
jgi:DHA2 family multidrug resistance protein